MLLSTEWDVIPLAKWFIENWHLICTQFLSIPNITVPIMASEGIAQAIHRLQEQQVEDEWFDALYNFREHHSLRFSMRGANIPEVFLGYNRGNGEISSDTEFESWFYSFNLEAFQISLRQNLQEFFKRWLETASNTTAIETVQVLQSRLENV